MHTRNNRKLDVLQKLFGNKNIDFYYFHLENIQLLLQNIGQSGHDTNLGNIKILVIFVSLFNVVDQTRSHTPKLIQSSTSESRGVWPDFCNLYLNWINCKFSDHKIKDSWAIFMLLTCC